MGRPVGVALCRDCGRGMRVGLGAGPGGILWAPGLFEPRVFEMDPDLRGLFLSGGPVKFCVGPVWY